jgi:hypothetical protein
MPAVWMVRNSELEIKHNTNRHSPHSPPVISNTESRPSIFDAIVLLPPMCLRHALSVVALHWTVAGEPRRHPTPGFRRGQAVPPPSPVFHRRRAALPLPFLLRTTCPFLTSSADRMRRPSPFTGGTRSLPSPSAG